jgi:uncharacterized protein (TIGR00299 family) protein
VTRTETIGYLDCSTGVSGDKFLGALLDAGADGTFTAEHLQAAVTAVAAEALVVVEHGSSHGIAAVRVRVEGTPTASASPTHRHWRQIRELLEASTLPAAVRDDALRVFGELAEAEARAHGCDPDDVHFHEVGALDSILDVVGVCAGVHTLGIDRLIASPVATGWGTVESSHGLLPVPAPATAHLLLGTPVNAGPAAPDGLAPGELTTPTGAALVRVLASGFGPCPPLTPARIGYGAGTRDIGSPNVCRITLGAAAPDRTELVSEPVALLETTIDHLSPEAAAVAADQLLAEGALDVWMAPAFMKKGRAGFVLTVLVGESSARGLDALNAAARIVELTGSLGVRHTALERFVAPREVREIATEYGLVRVKVGPAGATPRYRPEAEDVARIARETGRAFSTVERELATIALNQLDG